MLMFQSSAERDIPKRQEIPSNFLEGYSVGLVLLFLMHSNKAKSIKGST